MAVLPDRLQTALEWLGEHDHAGAAAEGAVVDAAVVAFGVVAWVPQAHLDQARLERATRHPRAQQRREQLWEQGDDVKTHGRPQ
jgi:hypothetical protein